MRIAVITTRFPEHGRATRDEQIHGDQVRAFTHISHLARAHAVDVITGGAPSSPAAAAELAEMATIHRTVLSHPRRALSALSAIAKGEPAEVGWSMPATVWRSAQDIAAVSDVALAMTARSVRGPLACPFVVDHVDALSRNLSNRASGSESLPVRSFARIEARLMERWEVRVAGVAQAQVVTSDDHGALLPSSPPITVLPVAWDGDIFAEPPGHARPYDVILTGDMHYPPNREAALALATDILPLVRARRPNTSAVVAGRAAKSLNVEGVTIASDVPDLFVYLRQARVAVVPLFKGPAGSPYKVIEAAANGVAVVAVPWAVACFGLPALTAETPTEFADRIVSLLHDEPLRRRLALSAIPVLEQHSVGAIGHRLEDVLRQAVSS